MASREYFTAVPEKSHVIDTNALTEFYKEIDIDDIKPIVKKIIDNTMYVSFEEFNKQLELNVVEYYNKYKKFHIENKRPIFIYSELGPDVPQGNFKTKNAYKSNNWCFNFVFNKMTELAINDGICVQSIFKITDDNKRLNDDDIIIFTDDCVYSGQPLGSLINTFAVYKDRYKFYMLIPYASEKGIENIIDNYERAKPRQKTGGVKRSRLTDERLLFSNYIEIPHISKKLSPDEIEKMCIFYTYKYFKDDTYLIYFNHKLAGFSAVPTVIYLGIVPNKKNLKIIHSTDFKGFTADSSNLDIIPIISNCSKKNISIDSPKCPYPPYKQGSEQLSMKGGKRMLKSYK